MKIYFNKIENTKMFWSVELLPVITLEGGENAYFEIGIYWLFWSISFFWEFGTHYESVDDFMDSLHLDDE